MASAVLANRNESNWPQPRGNGRGTEGEFMGKVPFSNPNPKFNKKLFHGEMNGFQKDESPAVTQSASDDASSINHHLRLSNGVDFCQYVSFNVSSCSRKELIELKSKLISELEQIRKLKNRINSGGQHSRPKHQKKSSKTSGTKRPLPTSSNGKDLKRSNSENGNLMKTCSQILTKLMKHKHGWIFNKPVDVVGMGLHDYYDVVKRPMDLGSVKTILSKDAYESPFDFASDVRLTFKNAMTYNPKGHDVHAMAEQLLSRFEELFRPLSEVLEEEDRRYRSYQEELPANSWNLSEAERTVKKDPQKQIVKKTEPMKAPSSSSNPPPMMQSPVKTPSPLRAPPVKPVKQPKPRAKDPNKREMTLEEKHKLGIGLQSLPPEKMEQVVQIIKKRNGHLKQDGDEIELDIEAVDTETLWELDRLVTNWKKMMSKIKRQAFITATSNKTNGVKPTPEKMEVGSEMKKQRKGEAGEEDVDIGDEMPASNFPPVEIEKDAGGGRGASSSSSGSSSSSSDDSSSSSDSDSDGSSSGSDSDDNAQ
ncbi:Transcription factor GTE2, partial [Cucurbita argyrosperma subsp. argyrosperma]|uniref:transcription factor GTE7-like n=1 Tax=Cucurbita pepo subsp. pepo TaxID=3664 RepID=UPI000C9D7B42